jgi:hypothetical protein
LLCKKIRYSFAKKNMQNKKEHRTQMLQMITQWQQSGLSQRAFCANNNIAYHVFHYWYGVYRAGENNSGSFLPLNISPASNHEQITITGINGVQVKFSFNDQSVLFVKQLLLS